MYGSLEAMKYLPSPDAPHNEWLSFFQDKYERLRWAEVADISKKHDEHKQVATRDLLGLQQGPEIQTSSSSQPNSGQDFFAQYDL
jgi:hypothetical protein